MPTPAESTAEPLPKVRRGVLAQLDRPFLGTLATFLAIEFSGALALAQRPRVSVEEVPLEQVISDRHAIPYFPLRTPLPPPPPKPILIAARPALPHLAPTPTAQPRSAEELRTELRHQGALGVLTSVGNPLGQAIEQAVGPVAVNQQLEEAIKGAHGRLDLGSGTQAPLGLKDTGPVTETIGAPTTEGGTEQVIARTRDPGAEPLPGVVLDHPEVPQAPGIDRERITRFVKSQLGRVQACYEHELKLNPDLHGRLVLRFVVGTDGSVVDADADEDTLGSEALERCVVDHLAKRWTLPVHPEEDTPVIYPFVFAPQGR